MEKMKIEEIIESGGKVAIKDPILAITPSAALKLGDHKFELTVVDEAENESEALGVVIWVIDTQRPNAHVAVLDEKMQPLSKNEVPLGASFVLNAEKSFDPGGGAISSYVWRYVGSNI